ncbi:ABC transporter permease [Haloferax sp. ATB1]|uniref:ABC transporter permease n=1 Tax=Haloferax sp. ATB1 TaxID=1508454 RepID=UPI0005B21E77|nr:ABC transporter permease [Haloferax sp. ATB1]
MTGGTWTVARRILRGIRGDRMTIGLVIGAPVFIMYLVSEVFADTQGLAPMILGILVFVLTYMLTSIGFLRERQAGTLERILVAPISRTSIVVGYFLGYGVLATIQSLVLLMAALFFLEVEFAHGIFLFFVLEILGAMTAIGIGILLSLFADNEFQAIQFIPLVLTPQVVLGGTFTPIDTLPLYLRLPARVMPLTYLVQGMDYVIAGIGFLDDFIIAVAVLIEFTVLAIGVSQIVINNLS